MAKGGGGSGRGGGGGGGEGPIRTYRITKGAQYDPEGATVWHGRNEALVTSYSASGRREAGEPVRVDDDSVIARAVRRVIASGRSETITRGKEAPRLSPEQVAANRTLLARMRQWERTDI